MDTICQMCGDKGFSPALIYCDKCEVYAQHRYCLEQLPETFDEYVIWFCEDCEPKIAKPNVCVNSENVQAAQSKSEDSIKNGKKNKKNKEREDITSSMANTELQRYEDSSTHQLSESHCSKNCEKDLKFGKQETLILEERGNSDEEAESDKRKTSQIPASDPSNILEPIVHSQPIIDPIWRGSISICNEHYGTVGKFVAHMSSLACEKVWEATKLLPQLLCLELLPRSDVWPKGFKGSEASDDSIAHYFFPENERDERAFDSLVEDMINKDLALRAVVENAELLIFTSRRLTMHYWRFQGKFYLWGVFRRKQVSHSGSDAVPREKKDMIKTIKLGTRSPISPLSNSGSCISRMY